MQTTTKTGLFFGIWMAIFFTIGGLLTQDNTTEGIIFTIVWGLVAGAVCGLGFGWIMRRFTRSEFVAKTTKINLPSAEHILLQSPANHFKGIEAVGGKLYLTGSELIFKSHSFNIQNHTSILHRSDIAHVERYRPLGLTNNGLAVTTKGGRKEKFVVENVAEWLKILGQDI